MKENRRTVVKAACGTAIAALLLAGCGMGGKATEPYKDAKRAGNCAPRDWVTNRAPDGFSNIATACLITGTDCSGRSGLRITVAYKGDSNRASVATVPDDNC